MHYEASSRICKILLCTLMKKADVSIFLFFIVISELNTVFCIVACFFCLTFPELLSLNRFFIICRETHESVHKNTCGDGRDQAFLTLAT